MEVKQGICGLCGESCIVDIHIENNKIKYVSPSTNKDGSKNKICIKGQALKQYTYNKERVLYPMIRIGKRGSNDFERISWDKALDLLAEKMLETKEKFDPKETMIYIGHPKWFRPQLSDFAARYGTPNYGSESSTCAYALMLAARLCFGKDASIPRPDFGNLKSLIIWGANPMYSNTVGGGPLLAKLHDKGVPLIGVDPRKTPTTDLCQVHLQLKPGTDGALALGLARLIMERGLADLDYINEYTYGYGAYKDYVMSCTLEDIEKITGVKISLMEKAVDIIEANSPCPTMLSAAPVVHNINGVQNARLVLLLNALLGTYGKKGGLEGPVPRRANLDGAFMGMNSRLKRPRADEDLSHDEFPAWSRLVFEECQVSQIAKYLEGSGPYPIRTLLSFGMNHHMWPRPDRIEEAFDNLGFFANADSFFTKTSAYADLVLPVKTSIERNQINVIGRDKICYQEAPLEPIGESKSDIEILIELSKRLGFKLYDELESEDDYFTRLISPTGLDLAELKKEKIMTSREVLKEETEDDTLRFKTPSGKIEFKSMVLEEIEKYKLDSIPKYYDFRESLSMDKYPFILSTGNRKTQLFHSRTYRLDWLSFLEDIPLAEIHPEDGKNLDIKDGEYVYVETPVGRLNYKASFNKDLLKGVVSVYHGPIENDINKLIDDKFIDPISGFPGYKGYCCNIERCK